MAEIFIFPGNRHLPRTNGGGQVSAEILPFTKIPDKTRDWLILVKPRVHDWLILLEESTEMIG